MQKGMAVPHSPCRAGGGRVVPVLAFLECVHAPCDQARGSTALGSWSSAGGLWAVLCPQSGAPGSPHPSTAPPDRQRHPQPSWLPSNIYGNLFVLRWRFLGSDLDRPLLLSKMSCQIHSEISFIPSSSLTQRAPTSPVIPSTSLPPPLPSPHPQIPAPVRSQPSRTPCASLQGSALL